MSSVDPLATDARAIDAHLRAELDAKRITSFTLVISAKLEVRLGKLGTNKATTYAHVKCADDKEIMLRVPSMKLGAITAALTQPAARLKHEDRETMRAELARAREKKLTWNEDLEGLMMRTRLRTFEDGLKSRAMESVSGCHDVIASAVATRVTRFSSDGAAVLARDDETWLDARLELRFRDSPPPRMYGEDHEPEHYRTRVAELRSFSWPDEQALADLVKRASVAPTF